MGVDPLTGELLPSGAAAPDAGRVLDERPLLGDPPHVQAAYSQTGYASPPYPQQSYPQQPYPWQTYPPGYGSGPPTPYRVARLGNLTTTLTVLLSLCGFLALLVAIAAFGRASVLSDILDRPLSVGRDRAEDADAFVASAIVLYVLSFLACGVVWMIWQYRHATNARILGQRDGLGPGWAVGGWFIPLGNMVLPQLQLAGAAKTATGGRLPGLIIPWWTCYAAGNVLIFASAAIRPDMGDEGFASRAEVRDARTADSVLALSGLASTATAVMAIFLVRQLTRRQERLLSGMPA